MCQRAACSHRKFVNPFLALVYAIIIQLCCKESKHGRSKRSGLNRNTVLPNDSTDDTRFRNRKVLAGQIFRGFRITVLQNEDFDIRECRLCRDGYWPRGFGNANRIPIDDITRLSEGTPFLDARRNSFSRTRQTRSFN